MLRPNATYKLHLHVAKTMGNGNWSVNVFDINNNALGSQAVAEGDNDIILTTGTVAAARIRFIYNQNNDDISYTFSQVSLVDITGDSLLTYVAEVISATDYSPFGAPLPGRTWYGDTTNAYRFTFNGKETDDEISGEGNHYTAQFWEMDPRLGRRWERAPVVKHHESPYAILGNNPIWFVDPNGADSSLYNSNTGAFMAKGVTPEDDKTAIWTVDPTAKGYDKNNPWATAKQLTYSVGEEQKTEVGKDNLRKNHPLAGKGWTYGAQVYEEDLLNMTKEFNSLLVSQKGFFEKQGEGDYFGFGWSPGGIIDKMTNWILLVKPNAPFDLKSRTRSNQLTIPSYAAVVIGQYSFYGGRLMSNDDYGNVSYGYWGKSYGYSYFTLRYGASWAQKFSTGTFDPKRDSYMLELGFDMNND